MTGRRYYITTLADWHRHAHRFANSHWLALGDNDSAATRELTDATRIVPDAGAHTSAPDAQPSGVSSAHDAQPSHAARIIVLIDADAAFEALPHPFAPKAISHAAHEALAAHGVTPGSTTFDAAEAIARAHPLLRPRVF
jgi:hypothetical protein